MATFEELVTRLADNAVKAWEDSGGRTGTLSESGISLATRLQDFVDEQYTALGGGEVIEQGVVDELQRRGMAVGNHPDGSRIFGTQEQVDATQSAALTPEP